jgi:hypothetical protein
MTKKRLEILFESREQWRIFSPQKEKNRCCPFCDEESPLLSIENLAGLTATSQLEIFREIERGQLHFIETPQSRLFVCLATFSKRSYRNDEQGILVNL